jgi:c-di-GMP-binding flagellar brake protein YcgR
VNFVLQKPLTPLNASRCFHAALGFMEREKRRYYRQPVKMLVKAILSDKEIKATSTNISEGGIALLLHQALPKSASPRVQFTLPGTNLSFDVETSVTWADIKGHVGLRFLNLPKSSQEQLEKWLNEQIAKSAAKDKAAGKGPETIQ